MRYIWYHGLLDVNDDNRNAYNILFRMLLQRLAHAVIETKVCIKYIILWS